LKSPQPFGGNGWSGTGLKTGVRNMLHRFDGQHVVPVNASTRQRVNASAAGGGNAVPLAPDGK